MFKKIFLLLSLTIITATAFADIKACRASDISDIIPVDGTPETEDGYINIRIADAYTDKAIAGAVIVDHINCQATKDWPVGEKGWAKMKLRNATPDHLSLTFKADDYIPVQYRYQKSHGLKMPAELKVYMEKGQTIGGFVQNQQGQPIKDVKVEIWNHELDEGEEFKRRIYEAAGKTDAKGFWQIENIWPEDYKVQPELRLTHPDYISDRWGNQSANPDLSKLKDLKDSYTMKTGLTISGTVTDENGNPLAKAHVKSGDDRFGSNSEPAVKTDKNGHYKFKAMRPLTWTFTVEHASFAPQLRTVNIDKNTEGVDFVLKPGKTIKIKVQDSDGNPIKGAGVSADTWKGKRTLGWRKNTGADGMVAWTNVPDGVVEWDIYHHNYMDKRKQKLLPNGDQVHEITLPPPLVMNVTVIDSKSGNPVKEFKAYRAIMWEGNSSPHIERHAQAIRFGKDGKVEAKFDHPYYKTGLQIEADGYFPKQSEYFLADAGTVECTVKLEKGANITGQIQTPDNQPAVEAIILIKTNDQFLYIKNGNNLRQSGQQQQVKADQQGQFKIPPQEKLLGIYIVHDAGYKLLINPKASDLKNVRLDKWATIEGTAMVGNKPYAGSQVALSANSGKNRIAHFDYNVNTDDQGRFKFTNVIALDGLSISKYIITRQTSNGHSASHACTTPLDVKPGDHLKDIVLGGGGRKIVGSFVIEGANEKLNWTHGRISLKTARSSQRSSGMLNAIKRAFKRDKPKAQPNANYPVVISADGTFVAEDVKPGTYEIDVQLYQESQDSRRGDYDWNKRTVRYKKKIAISDGSLDKFIKITGIKVTPNAEGKVYYGIEPSSSDTAK